MKKLYAIIALAALVTLTSCGAAKEITGTAESTSLDEATEIAKEIEAVAEKIEDTVEATTETK